MDRFRKDRKEEPQFHRKATKEEYEQGLLDLRECIRWVHRDLTKEQIDEIIQRSKENSAKWSDIYSSPTNLEQRVATAHSKLGSRGTSEVKQDERVFKGQRGRPLVQEEGK